MKRFIAALSLVVLSAPVSVAIAGGNNRFALDREWTRFEMAQKRQNERFKRLERQADKAITTLKSQSGSFATPGVKSPVVSGNNMVFSNGNQKLRRHLPSSAHEGYYTMEEK